MSGFYVLDVPEFAPVVAAAGALDRCRVHQPRAGYIFVEFDGEIELTREATGLGAAVWFGCLTGGLDGKIVRFDANRIRLAPTNEPVLPI
ncbi:hypothetical protein [uncultured Sphingomonas sp.]|uniref:hypothetical protein n=1 Tax=uncultured Sphingomonas sp. TaxID=158754 RepID=UPI0035CA8716